MLFAGDRLPISDDVQVMREDLLTAAELGANGVVMGMLTQEGDVDAGRLSDFMLLCRSLVRTDWSMVTS